MVRFPRLRLRFLAAMVGCAALAAAQEQATSLAPRTWTVDGVERSALVAMPAKAPTAAAPAPLVFVFHGHGGRSAAAARGFGLHELLPQAIVVYPQGLPTPGRLTDPDGKRSGWQAEVGDQGDRDLRFVDAMLATLRAELAIDERRIHATGHSNGGGFTYLLYAARSDAFASFAPSAAGGVRHLRDGQPIPRPLLHVAGRADALVPFATQQRNVQALVADAGADAGAPWDAVPGATVHRAKAGMLVATWWHDGGHEFPAAAPPAIAAFFRATPKPEPWTTPPAALPGVVQHVYESRAARTAVSYHVYLPPGYEDDADGRRYPVVYWLHGSGGGDAGLPSVARAFEAAMRRGDLPPCLVVYPNGLPQGMWCDSVDGSRPVEAVVLGEIVPRVDAAFRTLPDAGRRGVAGFSMGGYGALRFGLSRRDLFGAAASLGGGPLQPELVETPRTNEARRVEVLATTYGGVMAEFVARSPWRLAEVHRERLRDARLLVACGAADETLPANRGMRERLDALGIPHTYLEPAGIGHEPVRMLQAVGPQLWRLFADSFASNR
jgi:polyhydroxybutyrate depolymerase